MCPYLIKFYLESIPAGTSDRSLYSAALLVSIIACCYSSVFIRSNLLVRCFVLSLLMRKSLTALLFEKLLRLPVSGVASATPGKLISLASGDMALVEQGAWQLPYIVVAPLSSIFLIVLLYTIVR